MNRPSPWLAVAAGFLTVTGTLLLLPAEASAQRRAMPRRVVRPVIVRPVPIRPIFYAPYYAPYYGHGLSLGWYGWGGWYPYGFYGPPYPYYPAYYRDYASAARILVEPKHAEVYVNGYFAGTVDDFDGWAQRLRVPPGEHVVEIYLEGFRTYRQNVLFRPGGTIRIQHVLEPLPSGEPPEPRPTPSQTAARPATPRPAYPPRPGGGGRPPSAATPAGESQTYGSLAVRVQPADAEIIVNGESWASPEAGDLTLQLAEGTYSVEIRRDGFRPYRTQVQVRRDETTALNVSLSRD